MSPDARKRFTTVNAVLDACAALPVEDRLLVLEIAWLVSAKQARTGAPAASGGFPSVQASQVAQIEAISLLIRQEAPDLALDRLLQDGDYDGVANHVIGLLKHDR